MDPNCVHCRGSIIPFGHLATYYLSVTHKSQGQCQCRGVGVGGVGPLVVSDGPPCRRLVSCE